MELRNPFGLRDNKIILIEDVPKSENGLRCNCVCPACKAPFEARMGDIRRHHFAHSGQGCDEVNAYLAGLYMLLNEYLNSQKPLFLPPVIVYFQLSAYSYITENNVEKHVKLLSESVNKKHEVLLYKETRMIFDSAEIIINSQGQYQAIIAKKGGRKLAIRITPPDTVCKPGKVTKFHEYPTVEINLCEAGDFIQQSQKTDFFSYLTNHTSIYHWIYNLKIKEAYPKIYILSKDYYEAEQERMKKKSRRSQTIV